VVRGTYLKISAEKKAEIGQHAVEHGVLATVRYYAMKVLVTTGTTRIRSAGQKLINLGHGVFEQHICAIISMKFPKKAIVRKFRHVKYKCYTVLIIFTCSLTVTWSVYMSVFAVCLVKNINSLTAIVRKL